MNMIDITEKGTKYMRGLLEVRHRRDLTRYEIVDLAILGNVWDLRELAGGPIELPGGLLELSSSFETDIVDEILRVRPTYSRLSTKQLIHVRLNDMRREGLLEHILEAKTTLSPAEALKEIERVDKLLDQRGIEWERER